VAHHHAQIVFNGRDFQLEEADREGEILINGKKKRRGRLAHGDRITLGRAQLGFSMFSELEVGSRAARRAMPTGTSRASGACTRSANA
jgi:hypothetical protein